MFQDNLHFKLFLIHSSDTFLLSNFCMSINILELETHNGVKQTFFLFCLPSSEEYQDINQTIPRNLATTQPELVYFEVSLVCNVDIITLLSQGYLLLLQRDLLLERYTHYCNDFTRLVGT